MEPIPKVVVQRLQTVSDGHPDANLLTAFAEKALLPREQARVLDHLAGCTVCRDVVAASQPETVEQAAVVVAARPGWWRQGVAIRWAALAACVVIVGAVVISRV